MRSVAFLLGGITFIIYGGKCTDKILDMQRVGWLKIFLFVIFLGGGGDSGDGRDGGDDGVL
jgi:hypothetical protein